VTAFSYEHSPYPVREDLVQANRDYWQALSRPGTWWSGAQRVAIAAEVRNANRCDFCAQRREALSPYHCEGEHRSNAALEPLAVDAIHRIITDQSRITRSWIEENHNAGLSDAQYVELLGITVTLFSVDEFHRALGLPLEPLPEPVAGEPNHYRPQSAVPGTGFVPMIPADSNTGAEADLWPRGRSANVLRALSLVPNALREWSAVAATQYLSAKRIVDFGAISGRHLNRMQIELIAGRVSAYNECFY
jgi:hypothetical protein